MELAKGDSHERMLLLGLASNPNHELHDLRRKGKIVFQKTLGRCLTGTNRGKCQFIYFIYFCWACLKSSEYFTLHVKNTFR